MRVDDGGHDRHARQVHVSGAIRRLYLVRRSNLDELAALDDKRGVLDGRAAIAHDQPRAFENDGIGGRLRRRWAARADREQAKQRQIDHDVHATESRLHSVHRILQNVD